MKQLSNYQKKQMTAKEIQEYARQALAEHDQTRRVCGGEIYIEGDEYGQYLIVAHDIDGYVIDEDYADNAQEIEEIVDRMEEELADIQDGKEEDE